MSAIYFDARIDGTKLQKDIRNVNRQLKGMTKNFQKTGKTVDTEFNKISLGLKNLIPVASLATAGLILKNLLADSYKFSAGFSKAMREVQTISQAVQNDFDGISDSILNLAANSPDDAIKLAAAYYQIVSAGYDGAKGLELLKVSSKAATAGITDTKTAADGLTTILNAWGKDASEANKVADVMFKTVEKGKTTFSELAAGISQVAPMASSMGISFEEVSAAIASLTKQGTTTTMAITQIRSAMLAMNEVLGDGWSKTMSFQEGLQAIRDEAGGSDTKLKNLMGRVEGMSAVLAMTGDKAKDASSDLQAMAESTGSMEVAYNQMMQEADNKWSVIHNKWQRELKELGDALKTGSIGMAEFLNIMLTETGDVDLLKETNEGIDGFMERWKMLKGIGATGWGSFFQALFTTDQSMNKDFENIFSKDTFKNSLKGKSVEELNSEKARIKQEIDKAYEEFQSLSDKQDAKSKKIKDKIIKDFTRLVGYNDAINETLRELQKPTKTEENDKGKDAAQEVKTIKQALGKIKKYKEQLGTGTSDQDVELYLKISNEQDFIDKTAKEIREKLQKALNDDVELDLSESKGVKIKTNTKEIKAQLKPQKQLTAEEKKQLKIEAEKLKKLALQQAAYEGLAKGLQGTSEILGALSYATKQLDSELSESLGKMADLAYGASNLFASIASGNIVGAVSSGIGLVANIFSDITNDAERYADLIELANIRLEHQADILNNAKPGDFTDEVAKGYELAIKEQKDYEKQAETFSLKFKKKGFLSWSSLKLEPGSLDGLRKILYDSKEIDNLIAEGYTAQNLDEAKAIVTGYDEAIKKADELRAIAETALTGNTYDSLVNNIADAFMQGKSSITDFADTFEDLMKQAIIQSFKMQFLEKEIKDWYEGFTTDVDSGGELTEEEVKANRDRFNDIITRGNERMKQLLDTAGIDLDMAEQPPQGLTGAIKGITEETAGMLYGQVYAFRENQQKTYMTGLEQLDVMNQSVTHLATIAENTAHNKRLVNVEDELKEMNRTLKEKL